MLLYAIKLCKIPKRESPLFKGLSFLIGFLASFVSISILCNSFLVWLKVNLFDVVVEWIRNDACQDFEHVIVRPTVRD